MATVSDELVERVARNMYESRHTGIWDNETNSLQDSYRGDARAAIAALSTPEFVLPLAEEMLREAQVKSVELCDGSVHAVLEAKGSVGSFRLIDVYRVAYRAAKGE